jgi:hypothetical protein
LAQQGPPPRRPGRHSAPDPGAGQQSADPYAADPYPADPRGADPYGPREPYPPRDPQPRDPQPPRDDPYAPRGDSYDPRDDPYAPREPYPADPRDAGPYDADPYGADPYGARQAAAAPPQAPPRQARPAPARQAAPAPAAPAPAAPGRRGASPWQQGDPFTDDGDEADLPPWAGLTIRPARAAGTRTRAPKAEPEVAEPEAAEAEAGAPAPRRRGLGRGRAAAARLRKSRRRVYVYCGTAVVLAVAVAAFLAIRALPKHHPAPTFITTLQPGEFATVPGACDSVSPALLASYLPGHATKVNPAGTSPSYSQCSLTVDRKPVFRVLGVTAQAYQPSAVAAGNGSATANAVDNFVIAEQALRAPGKKSAVPPAQLTPITGLGTEAFRGVQVIHTKSAVNDLVTVMARQRNLVVTVTLQAQAAGSGYGPVDIGNIQAGALAVARAVLTHDTAPAATG